MDRTSRVLRGGSFTYEDYGLHASHRVSTYPENEYSNIGFRVAEVPEPATLLLFASGGLALLRRRRGRLAAK